ncbi:PTER protein, partial [Polypterus senegalus]|nr:PTER protein [Polypterus senegalus]
MSALSGKVQTVLGPINPILLGRTLTHEHLTMTFDMCYHPPPPDQEALIHQPIEMKNRFWVQLNPYSCKDNLHLNQETEAVKEELLHFKKAGGGTIVENTTTGIDRDVKTLKKLSQETGVNIVSGAGFYVDASHSKETRSMSVEKVRLSLYLKMTTLFTSTK